MNTDGGLCGYGMVLCYTCFGQFVLPLYRPVIDSLQTRLCYDKNFMKKGDRIVISLRKMEHYLVFFQLRKPWLVMGTLYVNSHELEEAIWQVELDSLTQNAGDIFLF